MFKPEWRFGEWHRPSERLLAYIAENAHYVDITPTPKPLRKNTRGHEARYRVGWKCDACILMALSAIATTITTCANP